MNNTFYKNYLRKYLFDKFKLNFSGELQPTNAAIRLQILKNKIKKRLPKCLVDKLSSPPDDTCMKQITASLLADLQKQNIPLHTNHYNEVFVKWYWIEIKKMTNFELWILNKD